MDDHRLGARREPDHADAGAVEVEVVPVEMFAPEAGSQQAADQRFWFAHELRPTARWQPDIAALRVGPTRIVVGIGAESAGEICERTSTALAVALGIEPTMFPDGHIGAADDPDGFAPSCALSYARAEPPKHLRPNAIRHRQTTPGETVTTQKSQEPLDRSFTARIQKDGSFATYVTVPDSAELFGTRRPVKVGGRIDGHPFTATLMPSGEGPHWLPIDEGHLCRRELTR